MRDNGLTASSYTSMGGIDPLVAEPVLTALAQAGIAAYCGTPADPDLPPPAGRAAASGKNPTDAAAEQIGAGGKNQPADGAAEGAGVPSSPGQPSGAEGDAKADLGEASAATGLASEDDPATSSSAAASESAAASGESVAKADPSVETSAASSSSSASASAPSGAEGTPKAEVASASGAEGMAKAEVTAPSGAEGVAEVASASSEGVAKAGVAARVPAGFEEIFVAADSEERARAVIERSSEDAEWKSLVEQFNAPSAEGHDATPVPRWPASEDVDEGSYEPLIDVPAGLIVGDTDEDPPEEPPARRREDHTEHFVPPEPPRGPKLDWISRAAWLGLIGGPLLLIAAALLDFGTGRTTTIAVVGFIGGFLTLVIRMKDRLPPEDTPDDGAVV